MKKIILKDNTVIEMLISSGDTVFHFQTTTREEANSIADQLTKDNLSEFKLDTDGVQTTYTNKKQYQCMITDETEEFVVDMTLQYKPKFTLSVAIKEADNSDILTQLIQSLQTQINTQQKLITSQQLQLKTQEEALLELAEMTQGGIA